MSNKKKKYKDQDNQKVIRVPFLNIILTLIVIFGFGLRFLTWDGVVAGDGTIQLKGADAYYFVREAQNVNNGGIPQYDPMFCYDKGLETNANNLLYSYILAFGSKFTSLEMATALSGPIFAALTCLAIVLILKDLFPKNDFAVIVGTAIASLTGIQFIARSYFGFGDRHVLETFFAFMGIWTLLRLIKTSHWKWAIFSVIFYGLYIFAWNGASMVILLTGIGILIQQFASPVSKKLNLLLIATFGSIIPIAYFTGNNFLLMCGALLTTGVGFIWFVKIKIQTLKTQLIVTAGVLIGGFILLYLVLPSVANQVIDSLKGFLFPDEVSKTISEFQPMFTIYQNFYDITSKAGVQVLIHVLTAIGLLYMLKRKDYVFFFLGLSLLVVSIAKIRGEYYLLIINAVSLAYIAADHKKFAYFAFIVAAYFAMLYWSYEVTYNKGASLVFTQSDYAMAEWMDKNLPAVTDNDNYWVMARWDLGYMYGYIGKRPMFSAPNLCSYLTDSQITMMSDENAAYKELHERNVKYILVKYNNFSRYYSEVLKLNLPAPEVLGGKVNGNVYYLIGSDYYVTLQSRLFNFEGQAYTPNKFYYFKGESLASTDNMDEVAQYSTNGKVYSISGFVSPVKLDALKHFVLVHTEGTGEDAVKLFKVVD